MLLSYKYSNRSWDSIRLATKRANRIVAQADNIDDLAKYTRSLALRFNDFANKKSRSRPFLDDSERGFPKLFRVFDAPVNSRDSERAACIFFNNQVFFHITNVNTAGAIIYGDTATD